MKDVVIGVVEGYNFGQISCWANSLDRCGFNGDKVLLCVNVSEETRNRFRERGFEIFYEDGPRPEYHQRAIHLERWYLIWTWIDRICYCRDYRYMIHTDVKDVIFQTNPSEWIEKNLPENKSITVASEGLLLKDEEWGSSVFIESYGTERYKAVVNRLAINSGTISGRFKTMADLCAEIYEVGLQGKARVIDQAALTLIATRKYWEEAMNIVPSSSGYVSQLGTMAEPRYYPFLIDEQPVFINGEVFTRDGKKFCMVHQYDRVMGLRDLIWGKYWEA